MQYILSIPEVQTRGNSQEGYGQRSLNGQTAEQICHEQALPQNLAHQFPAEIRSGRIKRGQR
jgi:hypothetical protein